MSDEKPRCPDCGAAMGEPCDWQVHDAKARSLVDWPRPDEPATVI